MNSHAKLIAPLPEFAGKIISACCLTTLVALFGVKDQPTLQIFARSFTSSPT